MKREKVLELGFKELPHFTIGSALIYNLGRRRHLSLSSLATPNEVMYLCETNLRNDKQIDDLVCIHNYDYDGYLTEKKLSLLLTFFAQNNKK